LIIATIFAVGFAITGFLIKSWEFALIGLAFGVTISGIGFGLNYVFKKENGPALLWKYLMPFFYIFLGIQALIALAKCSGT
jgi:hypothetical protein